MDNNPIQNQNNANPAPPIQPVSSEPIQNQAIAEPVTEDVRPSLAKRLHLKLFSLLAFVALVLVATLYYRNHPLPGFISSQADKLQGQMGQALRSSTIIQDSAGGSSQNTQRMIIESVGRSETTYKQITVIPGQGGVVTQDPTDQSVDGAAPTVTPFTQAEEQTATTSCVGEGQEIPSDKLDEWNCCDGLKLLARMSQGCTNCQSVYFCYKP